MKLYNYLTILTISLLSLTVLNAQESEPALPYRVAPQNLLKFNRFLINPTFSTVREDKSYINLLHRNQSVKFKDNDQTYFLSYSGRIGDRSGLGLSLYTQKIGAVSNIGVLANYAYGVKLSDQSNFTFGANLAYYQTGLDRGSLNTIDPDELLNGTEDSNIISFQPGFNISFGRFDFGGFAENLFEYNLKSSESLSEFKDKAFSGHLQYTYPFESATGILENARLMPLARVRMNSQRVRAADETDLSLGGSLILDLPKLGWLQGGYDSFYGASVGAGFNLNQRLSIGYTMEKGFANDFDNLGITHEISFAYSFTPNLTEDRVMFEDNDDQLVNNEDVELSTLEESEEIAALKKKLEENDAIIAELMFRQDSLESNRQSDLERRFDMVMRMVRNETQGERPDLEKKAEQLFLNRKDLPAVSETEATSNITNGTNAVASTKKPSTKPINSNALVQGKGNTKSSNSSTNRSSNKAGKPNSKKFIDLDGVANGYYIVANVYKGDKYLEKFMDNLNQRGVVSDYIESPKSGLKYVYLERYDNWEDAVAAYSSNLGGNYDGPMWVMNVDNRYTNEAYANNVNKVKEKATQYNTHNFTQNTVVANDQLTKSKPIEHNYKLDGIGTGFYIIVNVFANPKNANRFVKNLNSHGLSASYFINPENNWRYVYLKRHESWNSALISYYSKINDAYDDKMWIMRVRPGTVA